MFFRATTKYGVLPKGRRRRNAVSVSRRRLYRYINNSGLFVPYVYLPAVLWYDIWKGKNRTTIRVKTLEPAAVVTDWKTWLTREEDTDTCKNKFKYTHTYIINTARVTNVHVQNNKRRLPPPRLFIYVGCVLYQKYRIRRAPSII